MSVNPFLIPTTLNPLLEAALRAKLAQRTGAYGHLGELESLALRLGLIQNTTVPSFRSPQLLMFVADHGLVVERSDPAESQTSARLAQSVLAAQVPVEGFARMHGLGLTVVDCGMAESVAPDSRLLARKIAHGTRNARINTAMSVDQADAAIRAGMEIANGLTGNAVACAGVGVGSRVSAALVISRLTGKAVGDFILTSGQTDSSKLSPVLTLMEAIQRRHREVNDPVEVLAAMGGFEVAMMVGVMLAASGKRHLILVDGLPACAALLVATRIAPAVTDYCVYCRSNGHSGLDQALGLFNATALIDLGLECTDGTGASLAWPLIRCAASLLNESTEDQHPSALLAKR